MPVVARPRSYPNMGGSHPCRSDLVEWVNEPIFEQGRDASLDDEKLARRSVESERLDDLLVLIRDGYPAKCSLFAPPPGPCHGPGGSCGSICSRSADYSRATVAASGGSALCGCSAPWAARAGPGYLP